MANSWKTTELKKLKDDAHLGIDHLCQAIPRHPKLSIEFKAREIGARLPGSKPHWGDAEKIALRKMIEEGCGAIEIAESLGKTAKAVLRKADQMRLADKDFPRFRRGKEVCAPARPTLGVNSVFMLGATL